MSDMRDLLERLRSAANSNELRHEAADAIDSLTKRLALAEIVAKPLYSRRKLEEDNASLRAQLAKAESAPGLSAKRIFELEAQLASARKALEPFAAVVVPESCRDKLTILGIDRLLGGINVGHLRAAKAALTDEKGTP